MSIRLSKLFAAIFGTLVGRWLSWARTLAAVGVIYTGLMLSIGSARAVDYSIDFAIKTDAGEEVGHILCSYDKPCSGSTKSLGLSFYIEIFRDAIERASLDLHGPDIDCCFFEGAARSISVDSSKPMSRVRFYRGVHARGGLFIQNKYAGVMYLVFNSL